MIFYLKKVLNPFTFEDKKLGPLIITIYEDSILSNEKENAKNATQ